MRGLEKNCTQWRRQTDKQTSGHGNSMTNLAQWDQVGTNLLLKSGLRYLIGLIVEASESAKDCGQFHVFGTFLQYFFESFRGHVFQESETMLFKQFF